TRFSRDWSSDVCSSDLNSLPRAISRASITRSVGDSFCPRRRCRIFPQSTSRSVAQSLRCSSIDRRSVGDFIVRNLRYWSLRLRRLASPLRLGGLRLQLIRQLILARTGQLSLFWWRRIEVLDGIHARVESVPIGTHQDKILDRQRLNGRTRVFIDHHFIGHAMPPEVLQHAIADGINSLRVDGLLQFS